MYLFLRIFNKRKNIVGNLIESNRNIKLRIKIKEDFHLLKSKKFQWIHLINALGTSWKKPVKEEKPKLIMLSIYNQSVI